MRPELLATATLFFFLPELLLAADQAQDFQVRLLTPVASYSPEGTPFQAKILGPMMISHGWTLPSGTVLLGIVRQAKPVGLGVRRERALLQLEFQGCQSAEGEDIDCFAKLASVDNARERVTRDNRIEGILAADHPHSWLNGVWYRPTAQFMKRSPVGLIGAGGLAQAKFLPSPGGAVLVVVSRLLLLRLPDPEIALPAGTDLVVRLSVDEQSVVPIAWVKESSLSDERAEWLREAPWTVRQANGSPAGDLINIALISSRAQLIDAFDAAGWSQPEPMSARTFARTYAAAAAMKSYPNAPVSSLYYERRVPDLVFQKTFNSLAKRHHVRLWQAASPEGTVWLGAATHDTAAAFEWRTLTPIHRIDMRIDRERSKVLNDLAEVKCLASRELVARPKLLTQSDIRVATDGDLAVGIVGSCEPPTRNAPILKKPHRTRTSLLVQQAILEARQYFERGNAYYWTYRTIRWGISRRRAATEDQ